MPAATPVRRLDLPVRDGVWRLAEGSGVDYLDGAEELVAAVLRTAADRSSTSDELHFAAGSWAERYHLCRGRANVLRAVDLPADAAVLEIGAGCGAISRYLGERVGVLDAVEPVPARAEVAAVATGHLPNVRVFTGTVDDLPDEPGYDVAVVVGVLEYVGGGSRDPQPYLDFLTAIRRRLAPGGLLCLAIENQFGVKYLAGAPEDHTGRQWDGPQGYPDGGRARTFGRKPLTALLTAAGFDVHTVLGCFPDYKITRAVLAPALLERYPFLAKSLPVLPSPDRGQDAHRAMDESRLWAELVDAGQAEDNPNSFLVLAGTGPAGRTPWPTDRLAVYFNTDRASRWCTRAEVSATATGAEVVRTRLVGTASDDDGAVALRSYREPIQPAPTMVGVLLDQPWRAAELLCRWRDLVLSAETTPRPGLWDLVPHNVLVTEDGLLPIDLEWEVSDATPADVLARGLLLTADRLAAAGWSGAGERTTVWELACWLGVVVGLDPSFVDEALEREARFQAVSVAGAGVGQRRETEYLKAALRKRFAEFVSDRQEERARA
ncbi:MAG TPA: class I SAM-dependent methyltransferase [Pseudonocardiaceae bacterium]|nr:class I SAM-dependent methyltransferase [Pseudonocardiaceae bacterium]